MAILNSKLEELRVVEDSLAELNRQLNEQKEAFEYVVNLFIVNVCLLSLTANNVFSCTSGLYGTLKPSRLLYESFYFVEISIKSRYHHSIHSTETIPGK